MNAKECLISFGEFMGAIFAVGFPWFQAAFCTLHDQIHEINVVMVTL